MKTVITIKYKMFVTLREFHNVENGESISRTLSARGLEPFSELSAK